MGNQPVPEVFRDPTGKRWVNHSVVTLMKQRARAGETPQMVIRRLARQMVADAKEQGWVDVPYDPELLAELQGIEVKCAKTDIRAEARLMPLPGQRLEIEYAADAPETRRRFSICHELAHTFFPDCFEQVQHRRASKLFDPVHAELEQLCHVGAGELLMPVADFESAIAGRSPSMAVAEEMGRYFNASSEAALRRMVDLCGGDFILLWISERLKPTEEKNNGAEFNFGFAAPKRKLRVDYQFPWWRSFVPKHKSVPDDSMLYSVIRGESFEASTEDWSGLNLGNVRLEAVSSVHSEPESKGVMVLVSRMPNGF